MGKRREIGNGNARVGAEGGKKRKEKDGMEQIGGDGKGRMGRRWRKGRCRQE